MAGDDVRWGLGSGDPSPDLAAAAVVEAEKHGFVAAYIGESNIGADPFTTVATALSRTATIAVSPAVVGVHDKHPAVTARILRTLNALAPGRVGLGLGRRDPGPIEELGLPHSPAMPALRDTLAICRGLWAGERVAYDGDHWSAHIDASGLSPITISVALASVGPATLRLAGQVADAALLNYGAPLHAVRTAVAIIREAEAEAGRPAGSVAVHAYTFVARTDMANSAEQLAGVRRVLKSTLEGPERKFFAPTGSIDVNDLAVLRRHAAVGDADECHVWIAELRAAGVDLPVLLATGMRALFD